jgi:hypothetical protein
MSLYQKSPLATEVKTGTLGAFFMSIFSKR